MYANVIFTTDICSEIDAITEEYPKDKIFILTDNNTTEFCLNRLKECAMFSHFQHIEIGSGEDNKSIESVTKVWQFLSERGADRRSLMINLGGGMVTDLGSFVASTFKRGMKFINIPTTLLSQVDASVGGKTGFNFNGLKNEIGVINQPDTVVVDSSFLRTITAIEFISGFAEMLKHGIIASPAHLEDLETFIDSNFTSNGDRLTLNQDSIDYPTLCTLIENSVAIKEHFVNEDPFEHGVRKALNLGHTIGHAIESIAMRDGLSMPHGVAVAYGTVLELKLSAATQGFPKDELDKIQSLISSIYGDYIVDSSQYDEIYQLMTHDKKNEGGKINITLVDKLGSVKIDCNCTREEIISSFA